MHNHKLHTMSLWWLLQVPWSSGPTLEQMSTSHFGSKVLQRVFLPGWVNDHHVPVQCVHEQCKHPYDRIRVHVPLIVQSARTTIVESRTNSDWSPICADWAWSLQLDSRSLTIFSRRNNYRSLTEHELSWPVNLFREYSAWSCQADWPIFSISKWTVES